MDVAVADRWDLDRAQYDADSTAGHYESFYQRANHPTRPLAFWLRYTIFAPRARPADAIGELWAIFFDGETNSHSAAKVELPLTECVFARDRFEVRVGTATLGPDSLQGAAGDLAWDLTYTGDADPLLLFSPWMYRGGFPKAKSLVPLPLAAYRGTFSIGGRTIEVDGWLGSQNHNWGSRHTDRYAFAQVAGFDDAPGSFLETATAKVNVAGPVALPWMTFAVLRHEGREHRFTDLPRAVRAHTSHDWLHWEFTTRNAECDLSAHVTAPREAFVCLRYLNPPGGEKQCLNTKIASARLTLTDRRTGERTELRADRRALFEILTDDSSHGLPIRL